MRTTKSATSRRQKDDYTIVEMVRGFIEPRDANRWVRNNLDAFRRVAKGGRGSQIARLALDSHIGR